MQDDFDMSKMFILLWGANYDDVLFIWKYFVSVDDQFRIVQPDNGGKIGREVDEIGVKVDVIILSLNFFNLTQTIRSYWTSFSNIDF